MIKRKKYFVYILFITIFGLVCLSCNTSSEKDAVESNSETVAEVSNTLVNAESLAEAPAEAETKTEAETYGTLNIFLTDFPLGDKEVEQILITIEKVEVHKAGSGDATDEALEQDGNTSQQEQDNNDSEKGKDNNPSEDNKKDKGNSVVPGGGKGNNKNLIQSVEGGWITIVDTPQAFDLMQLQNDVTAPLGEVTLESGRYNQIRLHVNAENQIKFVGDDTLYPLKIPSGSQTGIKLVGGFEILAGENTELTIDFDAQKSVKQQGKNNDDYLLKPVISIKRVSN